jgi:hypothetical protein
MAVPAHSATALATAAPAAILITGTSTSASAAGAAVDAATGVPRQPVDQVLLLPAFRQCRLRAELLQLRDSLRENKNTGRS